jgi:hypothetical protein
MDSYTGAREPRTTRVWTAPARATRTAQLAVSWGKRGHPDDSKTRRAVKSEAARTMSDG